MSRNAIAKRLGIGPTRIKEMFDGVRMIRPAEAFELARIFDVRPDEMFRRLGYDWPAEAKPMAPIIGTLDAGDIVTDAPKPWARHAAAPLEMELHAIEMTAANERFGIRAGSVVYFAPEAGIAFGTEGRLCVVREGRHRPARVGVLIPAPIGKMRLDLWGGSDIYHGEAPVAATPVLFIRAN